MEGKEFCIYNGFAGFGWNIMFFSHPENRDFETYAERKMPFESGAAAGPEQGVSSAPDELGDLFASLRHTVPPAYYSNCIFCSFPVFTHDLHSAGIQKEQYSDSAVESGMG